MTEKSDLFAKVKLLAMDVDGVLTDGRLYYGPDGEALKVFNAHDGAGMKAALDNGIELAIISARESPPARKRLQDLGLNHIYLGVSDKWAVMRKLLEQLGINAEDSAYLGDDLADLEVIHKVGLGIAVADARHEVIAASNWQTDKVGGRGAVREITDLMLRKRKAI